MLSHRWYKVFDDDGDGLGQAIMFYGEVRGQEPLH